MALQRMTSDGNSQTLTLLSHLLSRLSNLSRGVLPKTLRRGPYAVVELA